MLKYTVTGSFKRDYKKVAKQGKDLRKINDIIQLILKEESLPLKCRDHLLIGNYNGRRECHIEPDWLLIYSIRGDEAIFERTGSHSELFS